MVLNTYSSGLGQLPQYATPLEHRINKTLHRECKNIQHRSKSLCPPYIPNSFSLWTTVLSHLRALQEIPRSSCSRHQESLAACSKSLDTTLPSSSAGMQPISTRRPCTLLVVQNLSTASSTTAPASTERRVTQRTRSLPVVQGYLHRLKMVK